MTPHWRDTEWADGIAAFGRRLRTRETTARAATERALARIAAHDDQMQAFVHVAAEAALSQASQCDALLAKRHDLGPLMGVPVGIKDLFAVDGMPTRAGSKLDVSHAIGPEGLFVARLREAGAIFLGKCRTTEFAAGAQNVSHPTPWNPADPTTHRSPGGSSNGSATAVAAGYCPLAIGSDTGGSVRAPAALCGLIGHKFTAGSVALDGVFPLCRNLDSVGTITAHPRDAQLVYDVILGAEPTAVVSLSECRIAIPSDHMLSNLAADVAQAFENVLSSLRSAGAKLVALDWPNAEQMATISDIFSSLVPADLSETIGDDLLSSKAAEVDPVALQRLVAGHHHARQDRKSLRHAIKTLSDQAKDRLRLISCLIYPTAPLTAPRLEDLLAPTAAVQFSGRVLGLTRVANASGMSACSIPMPRSQGQLPIGLDIATRAGEDRRCLALATAIHDLLPQQT